MVYKSEIVVNRIKEAPNKEEVRLIIDRYMNRLKLRNSSVRIDRKYTMNFLMTLEYHCLVELDEQPRANLFLAIEIVKSLHVDATETSW